MYTKLFEKILDSSIWLESNPTRIAWVTILAAMDEDGFCRIASIANLAQRAVITKEEAAEAIRVFESPDPNSSDPDHEGRRLERVPGGWIVLNAKKYQELAKREHMREQTRNRVRQYRENKRNADVTQCSKKVTQLYEYEYKNESDSEKEESNEDVVTSIGLEHPRNAHLKAHQKPLPCNQQQAIAEACMEDGIDLVRAGTLNYRDAVAKWPESERHFAINPVEFYGQNKHYLKDPKEWERPERTANGKTAAQLRGERVLELASERSEIFD